MAVDPAGNVYVADFGNHRIQKFDGSGSFLLEWGGLGEETGRLNNPIRLACDAAGDVYVADHHNHRIQKFTPSGTYVMDWGTLGAGPGQFDHVNGIAIGPNGHVFATDLDNNRIEKFGFVSVTAPAGVEASSWTRIKARFHVPGSGALRQLDASSTR